MRALPFGKQKRSRSKNLPPALHVNKKTESSRKPFNTNAAFKRCSQTKNSGNHHSKEEITSSTLRVNYGSEICTGFFTAFSFIRA
jgi:hypothetical protein